jgi:hypothetical protein
VVAALVAGLLVLGGSGFAFASYLAGGGTQPEDVLPADTLGFVRLDLDPSAGQKLAMRSLLEKFPHIGTDDDSDLRAQLLERLMDLTETELVFEDDVRPWLGQRMAVGVVPADDTDEGGVPVVALAVEDEKAMAEALVRAQENTDFGFAVRDDYVLITDSQERADTFATAAGTLADDADFAGDREALGGDQIGLAWVDMTAGQRLLSEALPEGMPGSVPGGQELAGRLILGVHAEDDALEMVGLGFDVSDLGVPSREPTRLVQNLPEDTLLAASLSGAGDLAATYWAELEETPEFSEYGDPMASLGLELPEDLRALFGTDLAIAGFGNVEAPAFGVRVVSEDGDRASAVIDELLSSFGAELPLVSTPVDDGFVLGSDTSTAQTLAAGYGGLGETDAFRDAVADPDAASGVVYVDLAALVDQAVARGGDTGEEAAKYSAVRALGLSATTTDEGGRFVLRITTR